MNNKYITYLLAAALVSVVATSSLQARTGIYNVACIKGRGNNLEKALKDSFQFRKVLLDAGNKGQSYTCFFRINDTDIKCMNPNYVRSGGDKELERDGYTLDNAISGGNLGKSKAGMVCYFKKDVMANYKDLISRLLEKNNLEDFIGAKESAAEISRNASSISTAKELLDKEIVGENPGPAQSSKPVMHIQVDLSKTTEPLNL